MLGPCRAVPPSPFPPAPSMSSSPGTLKKWLVVVAKVAIVALVLWFVRKTLVDAFAQLGRHSWSFHPGWLIASGVTYLVGLLPAALYWHHLLLVLGQSPRLSESIRAYYISHLGKYVPGKAMVLILRAGLIRSGRVSTAVAAVSTFPETLTMMAVGAFLAAAVLIVQYHEQALLTASAAGLMVVSGLPTVPPVFRFLARLAGIGRNDPDLREQLARFRLATLLAGWAYMTVCWVVLGASFWMVLEGMGVGDLDPLADLPLYTAAVALALVAGFVSFVPGGAIVREAVLAQFLVPHFGEVVAVVSALVLRLVWLVAELLISGILYLRGARVSAAARVAAQRIF